MKLHLTQPLDNKKAPQLLCLFTHTLPKPVSISTTILSIGYTSMYYKIIAGIFLLALLSGSTMPGGKEKAYMEALDSLDVYLKGCAFNHLPKSASLHIVSQYNPGMYNGITKKQSDAFYKSRCSVNTCLLLTNNDIIYIFDISKLDSTFFHTGHGFTLKVKDPKGKVSYTLTSVTREYNNKGGVHASEMHIYPRPDKNSQRVHDKVRKFLAQAIYTSKKL